MHNIRILVTLYSPKPNYRFIQLHKDIEVTTIPREDETIDILEDWFDPLLVVSVMHVYWSQPARVELMTEQWEIDHEAFDEYLVQFNDLGFIISD